MSESIEFIIVSEEELCEQTQKQEQENPQNPTIYTRINIDDITEIKEDYPQEFKQFCIDNQLPIPNKTTLIGNAYLLMLHNPYKYFDRETCNQVFKKFKIDTNDSIQQFNKPEQDGFKSYNSKNRGKYAIIYPYELSKKHKMRKDFKFDGTDKQKNEEIDKIKSTIQDDYIDVPNSQWQLGHKNPESEDNTNNNLVLQPPIQGKYRDKYIFLDTLTKIPTPKTIKKLYESGNSPYTNDQLKELRDYLNSLQNL
jgi:hypothetical protein